MASNFYVKTSRSVGSTFTAVNGYTVGAGVQTTVIGLTVANSLSGGAINAPGILIDAVINDGTNNTYIVRGASVPGGGSIVLVGGEQKIVLQTGYSVQVRSDTSSSADVIMSVLEIS